MPIAKPTVVPAEYVEVLLQDFRASGVVSLNAVQKDSDIPLDSGWLKPGTARYRAFNDETLPYHDPGIPAFGFDAAVDPFAAAVPLEYLIERPLGEFQPIPGVGLRLWNRPIPNSQTQAMFDAYWYSINGSVDYGVPMRCAALLTSYRKANAAPPFARVTWFIPRNDASHNAFVAAMWSTEDGNHAEPHGRDHAPFEVDDHEFLKLGPGGLDNTSSIHTYTNSFGSNILDQAYGAFNLGSLINRLVGVCTVFGESELTTYYSVDEQPWQVVGSVPVSSMGASEYGQRHTAFIHDICGGFPWLGAAGAATGDLALDLVQTALYAPISNSNITVPSGELPAEVTLSWLPAFSAGIASSTAVGTKVGDLTLPADVTSVSCITAGGRLTVVGSELRVGAALDAAQQPVLRFHLQGFKADGNKSIGRLWSTPVLDGSGTWTPKPGAAIDVDLVAGNAYDHGANVGIGSLMTPNGASGWNLIGNLLTALNRASGTYVVEWSHPGGSDVMSIVSTEDQFSEHNVHDSDTVSFKAGGLDHFASLTSGTFGAVNRSGLTFGASGVRGGLNGGTVSSTAALRQPAGSGAYAGMSKFGDRRGLSIRRITFWEDADRTSAETLSDRMAGEVASGWTPKEGAAIDVDLVTDNAFAHGVNVAPSSLMTPNGESGWNLVGGLLSALNQSSGTYVVEWGHPGGSAVMAVISTEDQFSEHNVHDGDTISFKAGGLDHYADLTSGAFGGIARSGVSFGPSGVRGGVSGGTITSSSGLRQTAGSAAFAGMSKFGDRRGLEIRRITFWNDADRISEAALASLLT